MEIFQSATRLTLLILILVLCGVNVFALYFYPDTVFITTWGLFKDIALMSATYFYAKSSQESKELKDDLNKKKDDSQEVKDFTNGGL